LTRKVEVEPVGYPGFLVMRPPLLSPTGATLKRIALAKLSDITLMSGEFGGEIFLFEPWLTLMVDHGRGAFTTGVYRTDSSTDNGGEPYDGRAPGGHRHPIWCLRKSEWVRAADHEQSGTARDLGEYLRSGPQVAHRLVFADRATHPEIDDAMNEVLAVLGSGIMISGSAPRSADWHFVALDLADERLTCSIEYSPLIAQSSAIESVMPTWLGKVEELLQRDGLSPDGEIRISIRRSIPEMTRAALREQR
jgi:hypothetical protein